MTRVLAARVALWLGLLSWASPAAAQDPTVEAKLELCNRSAETLKVAVVEWHPVLLFPGWSSHGWYDIAAGNCRLWDDTNSSDAGNWNVFLSISRIQEDGSRMMMDFGVDPIPNLHWNSETYGIERFFCIEEEAFRGWTDSINAETCEADRFHQLFNLFVYVKDNTLFTVDLS